jgi:hypothetical protein
VFRSHKQQLSDREESSLKSGRAVYLSFQVKGSDEVKLWDERIKNFTASWKHILNERNMSIFGGTKTLRNNRRLLKKTVFV